MDIKSFESAVGVSLSASAIEELADIVKSIDEEMGVNGSIAVVGEGKFELLFKGVNKEKVIDFARGHEVLVEEKNCFEVVEGINVTPKDFGEMVEAIDVNVVVRFTGCEE